MFSVCFPQDLKAFSEQLQQQAREHKKELAAVRAEVAMLRKGIQTHGEGWFYEHAYGDALFGRKARSGTRRRPKQINDTRSGTCATS